MGEIPYRKLLFYISYQPTAGSLASTGIWLFLSLYKQTWGTTLKGTTVSIRSTFELREEILTPYSANLSQPLQADFQIYIGGMPNETSTICHCSVNGIYFQLFNNAYFSQSDILFLAAQFRGISTLSDVISYDDL